MSQFLKTTVEFIPNGTVVLFADIAIKATAVLLLAVFANILLRRRSAAVRHRVWSLACCGLLSLPLLTTMLPGLRLPILPPLAKNTVAPLLPRSEIGGEPEELTDDHLPEHLSLLPDRIGKASAELGNDIVQQSPNPSMNFDEDIPSLDDSETTVGAGTRASATAKNSARESALLSDASGFVVCCLWGIGFLFTVWPLAIGFSRNAALQKGAQSVDDAPQLTRLQRLSLNLGLRRQVTLLETHRAIVPITWGILRPVVLFPVAWREWTAERRELVLLHELAHVKRLDVAWQLVARLVCALYWFHPLSWYALRRLRIERELACDDCVLMTGARPSEYARELVEMARSYQFLVLPTAIAMAQTTNLEQRIRSLLDQAGSHVPVGRMAGRLLLALAILVVTGIAIVRPAAKASELAVTAQSNDNNPTDPAVQTPADGDDENAADATAKPVAADLPDVTLEYEGRVVSPTGQPVPDAKIFFVYWSPGGYAARKHMEPMAATDADGRFEFHSERSDFISDSAFYMCSLVAVAENYGFAKDWSIAFETTGRAAKHSPMLSKASADAKQQNPTREFQLVYDDVPLTGRVVSTEGQPVAGVRIRIDRMWFNRTGSLDSWEAASKADKADSYSLRKETPLATNGAQLAAAIPDVQTDKDGRFVMKGIGRERVVQLLVGGAGVEAKMIKARTRKGKTFEVPNSWRMGDRPNNRDIYYPAEFTHVAGPSKPVVGRITDADTGEPISAVSIAAGASTTFTIGGKPWITTTTDADGRYRLEGLPVGDHQSIYIQPQSITAYVPAGARIQTKIDAAQIEKDIRLKKGIWVRGKTQDDRTGKPLSGSVEYFADNGNELLKKFPQFRRAFSYERRSDSQGRFAIAVPPGRGILTFRPDDFGSYERGVGAAGVTVPSKNNPGGTTTMFLTQPHFLLSTDYAIYREINLAVDSDAVEVTLAPSSGKPVTGKLLDPNGAPITDGLIVMTDDSLQPARYDDTENLFRVEGYYPDRARQLFFFHVDRNLAGYLKLEGKAPKDLTVTLQSAAAIRGRLVDATGAPVPGVRLWGEGIPGQNNGIEDLRLQTSDDGQFLIRGLVPGYKYNVSGSGNDGVGQILIDTSVEQAGSRDVGDVKLRRKYPETLRADAVDSTARATLIGRVIGPEGNPLSDAVVWIAEQAVSSTRWSSEFRPTKWKRLTQSKADGSFDAGTTTIRDSMVRLAATAPGFGWAWKDVEASDLNDEITLELVKDLSIEGQILSLDGKPAVGVKLTVNHVREKSPDLTLAEIIRGTVGSSGVYTNSPTPPFNGGGPEFSSVVTDAEGRFRIDGMGADRSVRLEAIGGGIGASRFRIITRATPEKLKPHGAVDVREGLPESTYFAQFTHVATPARTVRGTVTDTATGQPVAGVRISSQSSWHIMLNPVTTDANGRYEITGLPKMEMYRPLIFEPPGTMYFNKEIEITDSPGLQPITLDVTLATGITVKGKLTDRDTGQPLSGTLMYSPLAGNENWRTIGDADVANPAATSVIGDDGTYEISVLPGPGALTARTTAAGYVPPKIDVRRLEELTTDIMKDVSGGVTALSTQAGEQTHGLVGMFDKHALRLISPLKDTTQLTVDLTALRGRSLQGRIVDDNGQPLAGVKVRGLGDLTDPAVPLKTADFTVTNLAPAQKRRVYFHHAERKLGTAITIDGLPSKPLTVRMQPTGSIKLRFVDGLSEPLPDIEVHVHRVFDSFHHSDENGRVHISDIIPNAEYMIRAKPAEQRGPSLTVSMKTTVLPGQTLDLGTFTKKDKYQYEVVEETEKSKGSTQSSSR
ncbi:M56 family metallopeptidase [Fuerstiella marisgermanici]|uniref:Regulatory protein BlaR1 n=1 Tax=Fuerstiella marisgermanici TaxID=1891926 RepID=A0A1P8WP86_9PLAN|nr:M56 family metallopeptidase [Fuerstiella marisgermanici]APZ95867.1 Regulatory protein BlaR1 [Fuerstiella marisgermanici]